MGNEVREAIDRYGNADERILALLVETSHSGRDGGGSLRVPARPANDDLAGIDARSHLQVTAIRSQ